MLVGPDNGLLWLAAARFGGVVEAADIGASPLRLEPVSASFQAATSSRRSPRTSPPARRWRRPARRWTPRSSSGSSCRARASTPAGCSPTCCSPTATATSCSTPCTTTSRPRACAAAGRHGQPAAARFATTFADVGAGELLLYEDGYGALSLAVNRGSALAALGLARDAEIRIAPARRDRAARHAAAASPRDGLDERPRAGAGRRGAPHGTLVTAARSAPAAAARDGRGARRPAARCSCRSCCTSGPRCCRSPPPWPCPTSPGWVGADHDQVAQRRAARRPQARGDPRRGPAAGGLGGAGHRPQRRGPRRGPAAELHDRAATLGLEPAAIEPTLEALLHALEQRLGQPPARPRRAARARRAARPARALGSPRGRRLRDRRRRPAARRGEAPPIPSRSMPARCTCCRACSGSPTFASWPRLGRRGLVERGRAPPVRAARRLRR